MIKIQGAVIKRTRCHFFHHCREKAYLKFTDTKPADSAIVSAPVSKHAYRPDGARFSRYAHLLGPKGYCKFSEKYSSTEHSLERVYDQLRATK